MKRKLAIAGGVLGGVIGVAALVFGTRIGKAEGYSGPGARPGRGLVIGDSIGAHGGFVRQLSQVPGMSFSNESAIGASTGRMLAVSERTIGRGLVDVIVEGDLNDGARPASYTISNLRRIYRRAKDAGARVIAVTSTPWRGYRRHAGWSAEAQARQDEVRRWILSGADGLVDVAVDAYTPLQDPRRPGHLDPQYSAGDNLHLNRAGQERLGRIIRERAYGR